MGSLIPKLFITSKTLNLKAETSMSTPSSQAHKQLYLDFHIQPETLRSFPGKVRKYELTPGPDALLKPGVPKPSS